MNPKFNNAKTIDVSFKFEILHHLNYYYAGKKPQHKKNE